MPRKIENPKTTKVDAVTHDSVTTHPAFGTITVSRYSGHATLFQSDHKHHYYIGIEIGGAELHRSLNSDRVFGGLDHKKITVYLSEAQFASFVASTGLGGGTPCTIGCFNGEILPEIGEIEPRVQQFNRELQETLNGMADVFDNVLKDLDDDLGKIPAKRRGAIRGAIESLKQQLSSNISFIQEQFHEHIENVVESGKSEIEAYARNRISEVAGKVALLGQQDAQAFTIPAITESKKS